MASLRKSGRSGVTGVEEKEVAAPVEVQTSDGENAVQQRPKRGTFVDNVAENNGHYLSTYLTVSGPELGKYRIAIRYLRILDISTIRRHE